MGGRLYRDYLKRLIDFALAVIALIALSPVLGVVAFLVWRNMGTPILFRQERPGLNGKPFVLYKFRTMTNEKDDTGNLLPPEVRVTQFGQLLRRLSLDELPELINVVRGEMSWVGPRPLLMEYLPLYTPEQMHRHEVKPGITGWAQINGRNDISWEKKFALDVWYVEHLSPGLDIRILLMTVWKVFRREGIGDESLPAFRGSSSAIP